jgi:hypothetical protein
MQIANNVINIGISEYNVVITTDLEPDDILALQIFFSKATEIYANIKKYPIEMIVVGEGHSGLKAARMEEYIRLYKQVGLIPNEVNIAVVQGRGSNKNFALEGQELFSNEKIQAIRNNTSEDNSATDAIKNFLLSSDKPLIIQLKPVRDLLPIYFTNKELLKKSELAGYVSWNVRSLVGKEIEGNTVTKQHIEDYLNCFKVTAFYESFFATGSKNNLDKDDSPEAVEVLQNSSFLPLVMLRKLLVKWNLHVSYDWLKNDLLKELQANPEYQAHAQNMLDIAESIKSKAENEEFPAITEEQIATFQTINEECFSEDKRWQIKTITNIVKNIDNQICRADFGLALMLTNPEVGHQFAKSQSVILEDKFFRLNDNPDSSVFAYHSVGAENQSKMLYSFLLQYAETKISDDAGQNAEVSEAKTERRIGTTLHI